MARTQLAEVVHSSLEQRPIENDSSMEAALYGEVSHVSQPANLTAVCRSSRRSAAATWRETAHIFCSAVSHCGIDISVRVTAH